ncbi:sigma54 specific transcriptional regulator, Fis family [Desulfovibrio sp. DV]|uniref:sigma-54 interaction domain-containing protein n=1 Tax=Desulfovibrio sp. DV TaxID=1844708 RepID=UPI00094B9966|nr:sigma 54-interacting transcriptional regulator [Desulfovibrio sp. DV]OLN28279.1 sigma54 specific transcriptional regulator, Fis family [Desulfovibrio sp. DV]
MHEGNQAICLDCETLKLHKLENSSVLRRLQAVEHKFSRLLDHLPGMAYCCRINDGENFVLEFVSQGCKALLGYTTEELLREKSNTIERMTHRDDLEALRKVEREAIAKREPYQLMYRLSMSSGEVKWIWDQGAALYDEEGRPEYLVGIIMDVSAQKMQEIELREENERLRSSVKCSYGLGGIVGKSEVMQNVYKLILKAAQSDTNVIILGETGTGKDLVARTIHEMSGRTGKYVPVNCGAIPEQLLESEFFGHKKGAFSGAVDTRQGYLGAADQGTLFLDELGELTLNLQVKLLRAIESKQYTPVGDTVPRRSEFRLVTATNRDLKEMVQQKIMRADFFYRVHVLAIELPPIRQRKEDLLLLIDTFLGRKTGIANSSALLPPALRLSMEQYDWPGNIRELHNVLDRYLTFGEVSFPELDMAGEALAPQADELAACEGLTLKEALDKVEQAMIVKTLERNRWRRGETARELGLTLRTLQRKMKYFAI